MSLSALTIKASRHEQLCRKYFPCLCKMAIIDSTVAYRPLWFCFRLLAPIFFGARSRMVYVYVVLLHFIVTLMFPLHLLLGLLLPAEPAQLFQNLTMSMTCAACNLKHIMSIWHLRDMVEIESLLGQLDKCVQSEEEQRYYRETMKRSVNWINRCIYTSFTTSYYCADERITRSGLSCLVSLRLATQ